MPATDRTRQILSHHVVKSAFNGKRTVVFSGEANRDEAVKFLGDVMEVFQSVVK